MAEQSDNSGANGENQGLYTEQQALKGPKRHLCKAWPLHQTPRWGHLCMGNRRGC